MNRKILIVIGVICLIVCVFFVASQLIAYFQFENRGKIKSVGIDVYSDPEGTIPLTSVNWGILNPDSITHKIIYIKNNGTITESLSMNTTNWVPITAGNYLTLTWNCTDYLLNSSSIVVADLMLTVSPSVSGITAFSFDINIAGTEL